MHPRVAEMPHSILTDLAERRKEARLQRERNIASRSGHQGANVSKASREAFQAFWMRTVVDEFGEELDALRKVSIAKTIFQGVLNPLCFAERSVPSGRW